MELIFSDGSSFQFWFYLFPTLGTVIYRRAPSAAYDGFRRLTTAFRRLMTAFVTTYDGAQRRGDLSGYGWFIELDAHIS